MAKKKKTQPEKQTKSDHDDMIAQHIYRCAEMSYKMEMDRSTALEKSATQMLTAISVLSVALVAFIAEMKNLPSNALDLVTVLYVVIFLVLVCGFVLCLLARYRYKYRTLTSPRSVASQIKQMDKIDPVSSRVKIAEHYCLSIDESFSSVRANNNRATKLMRAATVLLIAAAMLIGFGILSVTFIALVL